jgi:preprotein translocase subunit SecG
MINFREILGLDNIVVKITFGFALVMLVISIILWLVGSSDGNK